MSIEKMLESGLFTQNSDGSVMSAMFSMQEQLMVQTIIGEIRSGRLDIDEAYLNFWTFRIDAEACGMTGLSDDRKAALLPSWVPYIESMIEQLEKDKGEEILKRVYSNAVQAHKEFCLGYEFEEYRVNPFMQDPLMVRPRGLWKMYDAFRKVMDFAIPLLSCSEKEGYKFYNTLLKAETALSIQGTIDMDKQRKERTHRLSDIIIQSGLVADNWGVSYFYDSLSYTKPAGLLPPKMREAE